MELSESSHERRLCRKSPQDYRTLLAQIFSCLQENIRIFNEQLQAFLFASRSSSFYYSTSNNDFQFDINEDIVPMSVEGVMDTLFFGTFNESSIDQCVAYLRNVMATRAQIIEQVQIHWCRNHGMEAEIWNIVWEIKNLQQLYDTQATVCSDLVNSQYPITTSEIVENVNEIIGYIQLVENSLQEYVQNIESAVVECNSNPRLLQSAQPDMVNSFVQNGSREERDLLNQMSILRRTITEKLAIYCVKQPMPIINVRKLGGNSPIKNTKQSCTRTEISLHIASCHNFEGNPNAPKEIPFNIALIPQNMAEQFEQSGLPLEYEISTRIDADVSTRTETKKGGCVIGSTFQRGADGFRATVQNISVTRVEPRKGRDVPVHELKYYFLITCDLSYPASNGLTIPVRAWTLSSPVFVCTHSSQVTDAMGLASWLQYFPERTRNLPRPRGHAKITEIMQVLQWHFKEWTTNMADRQCKYLTLNQSHLNALEDMILNDMSQKLGRGKDEIRNQIPLQQFYNAQLQPSQGHIRKFSFLVWFHSAATRLFNRKTSNNYLRELFRAGKIQGFISREDAMKKLAPNCQTLPLGYFMVRISEGTLSQLSVVYVHNNGRILASPIPLNLTTEDTIRQSFLECIYKKNNEQYILSTLYYPELMSVVSKEMAFPKPEEDTNSRRVGYVPFGEM